jgi:hypothetical protein
MPRVTLTAQPGSTGNAATSAQVQAVADQVTALAEQVTILATDVKTLGDQGTAALNALTTEVKHLSDLIHAL